MLELAILMASVLVLASNGSHENLKARKDDHYDSIKVLNRKRNAHACIMSIVFIVLYPLGAISIHLPISRIPGLRNSYLVKKIPAIHMPIQILGLVMMIGGFALGIRIAQDLGYFDRKTLPAHMIIGFIVVLAIILFQPIAGYLQHRYFKRTGGKSIFAYTHRWIGRAAIILGIINDGLGLQLAENDIIVPTKTYIRNFVIAGVLLFIWVGFVVYDTFIRKEEAISVADTKRVTPVEAEQVRV